MKWNFVSFICIFCCYCFPAFSQNSHTNGFYINTRFSFYSYETEGSVLLHLPSNAIKSHVKIDLSLDNHVIGSWEGCSDNKIIAIPIKLGLVPGKYRIKGALYLNRQKHITIQTSLIILPYKSNEVKTDRLTGSLIVNKRQFFPFGFYCYSPVSPTLPEEETVRGFNMMSPYQKISRTTFNERKRYMDRCAALCMKVHYNLLSVSGGGGVGSQIKGLPADSAKALLINEINAFKDHPALLSWYISDEPVPSRIPPDSLKTLYTMIKELDPHHPISVVFMAPFTSTAKKYAEALDIVMADPYPVPDLPASYTGRIAKSLSAAFKGEKPVWIAIQSFGGGEQWKREPTPGEIRLMTYQAVINGASGIQYFIRNGFNSYPKSTAVWAECGKMATEIQELTPWLLSEEKTIPVTSSSKDISVLSKLHNGQLMIMASNKVNAPKKVGFTIKHNTDGRACVIFENRNIAVRNNSFSDYLSACGTQVYMINIEKPADTVKPYRGNLLSDPGIEANITPGIPTSCYVWNRGDRGSTFFTDTREHVEGTHSIRLVTPATDKGSLLRFYPFAIEEGSTYYVSIWAKADTEQSHAKQPYFELSLGQYETKRFILTDHWKQYIAGFTVPYSGDNQVIPNKSTISLHMPSQGVAWFDLIQVFKGINIKKACIAPCPFIDRAVF